MTRLSFGSLLNNTLAIDTKLEITHKLDAVIQICSIFWEVHEDQSWTLVLPMLQLVEWRWILVKDNGFNLVPAKYFVSYLTYVINYEQNKLATK